ncbi:MAG TPA: EamA family transporter [Streptosporangiaceae bacterium]|nr:EamA family transporter [Streptosporangiaceae bacterium]
MSLQVGAAWAGRLFTVLPVAAVTGLRLWWAALVMGVIGWRGVRRAHAQQGRWGRGDWLVVLAFGVTLGVMNFCIYQAFARIPLGIAVTIEFLGPLVVAIVASRRVLDVLWVLLAGVGVLLLSGGGGSGGHLPGGPAGHGLDVVGVAFALVSAACWAAYILLSRATGRRFPGSSGLVVAMILAAALVTPVAAASGGAGLLRPGVLAAGAGIGVLSSVIPYWLELETLRRVPARVFGIWMSLEPAVAALAGLVILGEVLAPREWLAIGCVVAACAGAAYGAPKTVLR